MFQIPAIYLAEKYNYLTIVISPLIGLMNDQVYNLSKRKYKYVETINSDLSNIVKEGIRRKVAENKIHILYISPETLLSRSDITSLIGDRTIGMVIVDEAHIEIENFCELFVYSDDVSAAVQNRIADVLFADRFQLREHVENFISDDDN